MAFFGGGLTNTVSFGIPKSAFKKLRKTSKQRRGCGATGPLRVMAEKVVGIDLRTTNSAVGAMEGGKPVIIINAEGSSSLVSQFCFLEDDFYIGMEQGSNQMKEWKARSRRPSVR
ncbi:hypothetical protein RJ640_019678 [Escallonia rubra]|uniref:Heat shock protein 70 n=1 Tax=Escallonia rubra TaxID=112253 RepID=A0AA88UMT5_9ASTE|nr:hypothetical protein RJ640_019678 [Escallonia rubra]